MLKLIMLVFLFALAVSFACGYGVREWISRRRRNEARKKFYEKHSKLQTDATAPKNEIMALTTRREPTIRELDERLSRVEDRIADVASEIEAFRDETRSEFVITRELLERKFEEAQNSNDGRALAN